METIYFFIIGIPLVAGFALRVLYFDEGRFWVTAQVTMAVFACVGVGYAFANYASPHPWLIERGKYLFAIPIILGVFVAATAVEQKKDGFWVAAILALIAAGLLESLHQGLIDNGKGNLVPVAAAVVIFIVVGFVNAALGPIASGFAISAALHSILLGDGSLNIHIWKDVFDFFKITSNSVKIFIVVATSIAAAADTIATAFAD